MNSVRPVWYRASLMAASTDFGARIGHEAHRIIQERGDLVDLLAQLDPLLVVKIRRDMDEFLGVLLDGLHHLGVSMTGGDDGDAGGKIQKAVAIHIPHLGANAMIHDKGITTRVRR